MKKAIGLGLALALLNVLLVALAFQLCVDASTALDSVALGAPAHHDLGFAGLVVELGLVPGLVSGLVLGAIAGWVRRHRRVLLIPLALVAVVAIGRAIEPDLIPIACVPTLLLAAVLEACTRPPRIPEPALAPAILRGGHLPVAAPPEPGPQTSPAKGAWLGVLTAAGFGAVVYTCGVFSNAHGASLDLARRSLADDPGGVAIAVATFAALPGLGIGALLGALADQLARWPALARVAVLGAIVLQVLAVAFVAIAGRGADPRLARPLYAFALGGVLALEAWTRPRRAPEPTSPVA